MAAMVLHAADISNPVRTAAASRSWANRIMEEFFRQGDMEKDAGFPISPMCDRESTCTCAVQRSFIGSVVMPLYQAMGQLEFLTAGSAGEGNVFRTMHARALETLETLYPESPTDSID